MTLRAVLINLAVGATVFTGAEAPRFPSLIPCFDKTSQNLLLACATLLRVDLAIPPRIGRVRTASFFTGLGILGAVAIWLGAYQISPLGFGRGGPPIVGGFRVTRSERQPIMTDPGQLVVMAADSTVEIEPTTLPGASVACRWRSSNSGSIDDPASCDLAYQPPAGLTYDVLSLLAQPDCGLPDHVAEIKFSIAP
jgi:hypothetical protein